MLANLKAFLDTIAISELGAELLKVSDNGYNVLVGSTATHPLLFTSYADHPHILNKKFNSTAAGRYQLLGRYFDDYKRLLKLTDFGHAAQDAIASQQIRERDALADIIHGNFDSAVVKCSNIWASFPGNKYGQHQNLLSDLRTSFVLAGGIIT